MKTALKQAKNFTDTATGTASTTKPVRLPENKEVGQSESGLASSTDNLSAEHINVLKEKLESIGGLDN